MSRRVRVGILDSGVGQMADGRVLTARSFTGEALAPDRLDHGQQIAAIILRHAPDADLINAQVFGERMITSPEKVAAGLEWLCAQSVDLVNLSFGLRQDRPALRHAVEAALEAGIHMIAAVPARGGRVYPGCYPGVISGTGDVRCALGQVSNLGGHPADFGASPCALDGKPGGASFAVAHLTGMLARHLTDDANPLSELVSRAAFVGPERVDGG